MAYLSITTIPGRLCPKSLPNCRQCVLSFGRFGLTKAQYFEHETLGPFDYNSYLDLPWGFCVHFLVFFSFSGGEIFLVRKIKGTCGRRWPCSEVLKRTRSRTSYPFWFDIFTPSTRKATAVDRTLVVSTECYLQIVLL